MFIPVNLHYTSNHLWLCEVGRQDAYVGITDFGQKALGRIDSIELQRNGSKKKKGELFGIIYGSNKTMSLFMPFEGRILIVNPDNENLPERLNTAPYHYWIVLLSAKKNLVDNLIKCYTSDGYRNFINSLKTLNT